MTGHQLGLFGRGAETRILDGSIARLPERGGAVVVVGDPGIGKTALVDHACATAEAAGIRCLRARGEPSEQALPYALLADLLLPLATRLDSLEPPLRRAVRGALLPDGEAGAEPLAVCRGALEILSAASDEQPLLLAVDDVQWADPSSRRVLAFVLRRIGSERVLLLLAKRAPEDAVWDAPGAVSMRLGGLDDDSARRLLVDRGLDPLSPRARQLLRLAQGSPLVLEEFARTGDALPGGGAAPGSAAGVGPLVSRTWLRAVRELPAETALTLVYLAAVGDGRWPQFRSLLGAAGVRLADLAAAEKLGLVDRTADGHRLRHPILRQVLLQSVALHEQRIAVYSDLARVAPDAEMSAWYRSEIATGPDPVVAQALEEAALRAEHRGGPPEAVLAWRRAAELTPPSEQRARRLQAAAYAALHAGDAGDALSLSEAALLWQPMSPTATADIELVRGQAAALLGRPGLAHRSLAAAAEQVGSTDPLRAGLLFATATLPAALDARMDLARSLESRADALVSTAAPGRARDEVSGMLTALRGATLILEGEIPPGVRLLDEARPWLERTKRGEHSGESDQLVIQIADCLWMAERQVEAYHLLDAVIARLRRKGTLGLLPFALAARAGAALTDRWAAARADGHEALAWAQELNQPTMQCHAHALMALVSAQAGDLPACRTHHQAFQSLGGNDTTGLVFIVQGALGSALLSQGEAGAALPVLESAFRLAQRMGLGTPLLLGFVPDLVEAQILAGNATAAGEVTAWLARSARRSQLAWAFAAHARCRVLLAANRREAELWLGRAQSVHASHRMPYEEARLHLAHGSVLRRLDPGAARGPLSLSRELFASLGATGWMTHVEAMLPPDARLRADADAVRAAGDSLGLLSPQEFQVARLVARGQTNKEIAAGLYVVVKTVEAHLGRIFRKLEVRNRAELTRLLTTLGVD